MKRRSKRFVCALAVALLMIIAAGASLAEEASVEGMITEEGLLETTDGRAMEVADNEKGAALLDNAGKKVQVTGEITEEEGTIIISVTDFTIIE